MLIAAVYQLPAHWASYWVQVLHPNEIFQKVFSKRSQQDHRWQEKFLLTSSHGSSAKRRQEGH